MKLRSLFKSYYEMAYTERKIFIQDLLVRRMTLPKIKKDRKKKVELSPEEQALVDKILGSLK